MTSRKFRVAKLFFSKINYELPGSSTNVITLVGSGWGPHGNPNGFFLDSSQIQLDLGTESLREPRSFVFFEWRGHLSGWHLQDSSDSR